MNRGHRIGALVLTAWVALAAGARADLPPPDDKKFVGYGFRVDNTKAFPDYVLLAFPWSLSGGAPTKEHALVEDGKTVSVGRRSSTPELYAMKRSEYDTWKASYKPTMEHQDPALDELFASTKVVRCNAKLSPEFLLAKNDPRDQVVEAFRVEAIDGVACRIAKLDGKATPVATTTTTTTTTPDPAQPQNAPAPPPAPATPSKAGGCGGCNTERTNDSSFLVWASFAIVALARRPLRRAASRRSASG